VMPNFTVKDIRRTRFEGEFALENDPTYVPSDSEAAYLHKLKDTLTMLANDERHDNANPLQLPLADARRLYRKAEADSYAGSRRNLQMAKSMRTKQRAPRPKPHRHTLRTAPISLLRTKRPTSSASQRTSPSRRQIISRAMQRKHISAG